MKKDNLNTYNKKINSQYGEEGILEEIFRRIPNKNKWCVEFGAWDGKFMSNCNYFIEDKDWFGIFIESSKKRFKDLIRTYDGNHKVILMNKFVSSEGRDSFDNIASTTKMPIDFDLLSIDIDGNDYHIWKSMRKYKPKVVVIEFNPSIPNDIEFVQERNMNVNQGSSLLSLSKLGRQKGYILASTTRCNAIFVRKEFSNVLKDYSNSLNETNPQEESPRIYQLYDGTIMATKDFDMLWIHGVQIKKDGLQVLPKYLRFLDACCESKIKQLIKKLYIKWIK